MGSGRRGHMLLENGTLGPASPGIGILLHYNPRRRTSHRLRPGDLFPDAGGDAAENCGVRRGGIDRGDRPAFVGGLADHHVERHLAEELDAERFRLATGAAMAEDVAALAAMRAQEV